MDEKKWKKEYNEYRDRIEEPIDIDKMYRHFKKIGEVE